MGGGKLDRSFVHFRDYKISEFRIMRIRLNVVDSIRVKFNSKHVTCRELFNVVMQLLFTRQTATLKSITNLMQKKKKTTDRVLNFFYSFLKRFSRDTYY